MIPFFLETIKTFIQQDLFVKELDYTLGAHEKSLDNFEMKVKTYLPPTTTFSQNMCFFAHNFARLNRGITLMRCRIIPDHFWN